LEWRRYFPLVFILQECIDSSSNGTFQCFQNRITEVLLVVYWLVNLLIKVFCWTFYYFLALDSTFFLFSWVANFFGRCQHFFFFLVFGLKIFQLVPFSLTLTTTFSSCKMTIFLKWDLMAISIILFCFKTTFWLWPYKI